MDSVIAVLPLSIDGYGIGSEIYYRSKICKDERSCELFLKHFCEKRGISVKLMRKRIKENLKISRNIPYFVDSLNVFFPFKFRESKEKSLRRGFVNATYVIDIKDSSIFLKNGSCLDTLSSDRALWSNFNHARQLVYMALAKDFSRLNKHRDIIDRLDIFDF